MRFPHRLLLAPLAAVAIAVTAGCGGGLPGSSSSGSVSAAIFDGPHRFPLTIVRDSGHITEIKGKTLMWCPLTMLAPPLTFDDKGSLAIASDGSFAGDIKAPEDPGSSYWQFEGRLSGAGGSGYMQLFSPSAPNSSGCGTLKQYWNTDARAPQP